MPRWRIIPLSLVGALAVVRCASVSTAGTPEPRRNPAGVAVPSTRDAALEREIYELVNRHRRKQRLAPLALDARIGEQARHHSLAMATGRARFGHQGFEDRIRVLSRAMRVQWSAENVSMNQGYAAPARQAMEGWLVSAMHRANMEGPYDLTGIGVARNRAGEVYFTQIFIGR
jgi:uncharacterized protein YkwD